MKSGGEAFIIGNAESEGDVPSADVLTVQVSGSDQFQISPHTSP